MVAREIGAILLGLPSISGNIVRAGMLLAWHAALSDGNAARQPGKTACKSRRAVLMSDQQISRN
jgi:hypothetical protein